MQRKLSNPNGSDYEDCSVYNYPLTNVHKLQIYKYSNKNPLSEVGENEGLLFIEQLHHEKLHLGSMAVWCFSTTSIQASNWQHLDTGKLPDEKCGVAGISPGQRVGLILTATPVGRGDAPVPCGAGSQRDTTLLAIGFACLTGGSTDGRWRCADWDSPPDSN